MRNYAVAAEVEFTLALAAEETCDPIVQYVLSRAWPSLTELMPDLLEVGTPNLAFLAILLAMRDSELGMAAEPGPRSLVRAARACLETVLKRTGVTS